MAGAARKNTTAASARDPGPARGLLSSLPTDEGLHSHRRLPPPASLADWVQHFWSVRWDRSGLPPFQASTLPHPNVHLVVRHDGGAIHGVSRGRFETLLEGRGHVFGIKFRPGAFRPILGAAVSTLRDRQVGIDTVFGEPGRRYESALMSGIDDEACFAHAVALLEDTLPAIDPDMLRAAAVVDDIASDIGIVAVAQLQARHGLSLRALQRLFHDYVGTSPKWVINRYRLHEAIERLRSGRQVSWTDLALQLGYYDQAHFTRDFRQLVGCTPARFEAAVAGQTGTVPAMRRT